MLVTLLLFSVAGLLGGSFVNVVIHRGPTVWGLRNGDSDEEHTARREGPYDLSRPRSHCPACARTLGPAELIPLVSYAAQRGRCRGCGAPIGRRYPLVEAAGGASGLLTGLAFGATLPGGLALAALLVLLAAAVIDHETGYLPDALTGPALWLGLVASALGGGVPPGAAILGAAIGYLSFRVLGDGYAALRGREGLGRGDAKLLAAGGAWLGPLALPLVVLTAALAALVVVGVRVSRGEAASGATEVRFGPHLAGAIAAILLASTLAPALVGRVVPAWPVS